MNDLSRYRTLRPQIRTGDLIAVQGASFVSQIIKWRTKSPYSHVGMFVRLKEVSVERVFLLHSTAKHGVYLVPASRYLKVFKGRAEWIPLQHGIAMTANVAYEQDLLAFSFQQLGRAYDFRGVAKYLLPVIKQAKSDYFCSELVAAIYKQAQLYSRTFVSPGQFLLSAPVGDPVNLLEEV